MQSSSWVSKLLWKSYLYFVYVFVGGISELFAF